MNWQFLFLSANGRIGQKDFWIGWLILFVAAIVLGMIPFLGMIISIALIYPQVCIFSKRLHDFGKTGWLAAVPFAIGVVAMVFAMMAGGAAMFGVASGNEAAAAGGAMAALAGAGLVMMLAFVAWIGFTLWVGLTKGDPAANKYGAPTPSMFGGSTTPTTV
ncbi:MAG TPA: DUF805 domain-containing protein [Caulobacteraceae bacterium]|jgi:uncharacterized membrane protein YhaH (DUF805 family)